MESIGIGLVASRAMRTGSRPGIIEFLRSFESFIAQVLGARLVAVGGTHDAIRRHSLLTGYPRLERLPDGRGGGIVSLVARVVDPDPSRAVDWVICLLDPTDPTSLYPETQALKRQCVVHGKPFFSTLASAAEWCALEWARALGIDATGSGDAPAPLARAIAEHVRPSALAGEAIALIGHDARKRQLMEFVCRHHWLLSRFGRRLATGTTGTLLNGTLPARLGAAVPPAPDLRESLDRLAALSEAVSGRRPWVEPLRSGPMGGDAQIAEEVLAGRCRRVIFLEDPHVAREHEADIQLLERAARVEGVDCLCIQNAPTADRWACSLAALLGSPSKLGHVADPIDHERGVTGGLRLLADDLTGALDTAAELVGLTGPVHAFWHGALPPELPANAALDSGTRELDEATAVAATVALATHLDGAGISYKKVDSLLRGPTVAEAAACLRAGQWERGVFAPAFPFQGRVTRGGVQYATDAQGRWSATGGDIVGRLRNEGVEARPGRLDAPLPPGLSVFDAESDDDLRRIAACGRAAPGRVLWVGAGGLAQALAGDAPAEARAPLAVPILGLFGSDQAVTAGQLAACGSDWLRLPDGGEHSATLLTGRLESNGRALASIDLPPDLPREEAARRIETEFRSLAQRLPRPGTLLVAGGETLRGLCLSLGARSLEVRGRIMPGLPRSILRGGRWDGVTVISKSGAFGAPTLLRDLLRGAHTR